MASRSSRGASSSRTGLSVAAVAQLTVPAGVNQAVVQADGGGTIAVRFTRRHHADNHPAGQSITLSAADAAAAKFIGATGATVNAVYTL
jgi:hypothetical protein